MDRSCAAPPLLSRSPGDASSSPFRSDLEAVERLFDDEADLIVHHVDKREARIEFIGMRNRFAARFEVDQIMVVFPASNGNRERISGAMQHRRRERPC